MQWQVLRHGCASPATRKTVPGRWLPSLVTRKLLKWPRVGRQDRQTQQGRHILGKRHGRRGWHKWQARHKQRDRHSWFNLLTSCHSYTLGFVFPLPWLVLCRCRLGISWQLFIQNIWVGLRIVFWLAKIFTKILLTTIR